MKVWSTSKELLQQEQCCHRAEELIDIVKSDCAEADGGRRRKRSRTSARSLAFCNVNHLFGEMTERRSPFYTRKEWIYPMLTDPCFAFAQDFLPS